jgi:hypothetical protein
MNFALKYISSWLSDEQYLQWGEDFYKEYDNELMKHTGVSRADITKTWQRQYVPQQQYFIKEVQSYSKAWTAYVKRNVRKINSLYTDRFEKGKLRCEKAFQQML